MLRYWPVCAALLFLSFPSLAEDRASDYYTRAGVWEIESNIGPNGAMSYVLSAADESTGVKIAFWCQPAYEGAAVRITGPFDKNWFFRELTYVSYAVDERPLKQVNAMMLESNVILLPRESIGLGPFWRSLHSARHSFHFLVKGVPSTVGVRGFHRLYPAFMHMCMR